MSENSVLWWLHWCEFCVKNMKFLFQKFIGSCSLTNNYTSGYYTTYSHWQISIATNTFILLSNSIKHADIQIICLLVSTVSFWKIWMNAMQPRNSQIPLGLDFWHYVSKLTIVPAPLLFSIVAIISKRLFSVWDPAQKEVGGLGIAFLFMSFIRGMLLITSLYSTFEQ